MKWLDELKKRWKFKEVIESKGDIFAMWGRDRLDVVQLIEYIEVLHDTIKKMKTFDISPEEPTL